MTNDEHSAAAHLEALHTQLTQLMADLKDHQLLSVDFRTEHRIFEKKKTYSIQVELRPPCAFPSPSS